MLCMIYFSFDNLYIYDDATMSGRRRREVGEGDKDNIWKTNQEKQGADWVLTGEVPSGEFASSGKYLYLNFLSDGSVTKPGFKIQYDAGM